MAMNHSLRAAAAQVQRQIAARGGHSHQLQKRFSNLPRFSLLPHKQQFTILHSPNRCMTQHLSQRRLFSAGSGIQNFVANMRKAPNEIIRYIFETIWVYVKRAPGGFLNLLKGSWNCFLNLLKGSWNCFKVRLVNIWAEVERITDKALAKIIVLAPIAGYGWGISDLTLDTLRDMWADMWKKLKVASIFRTAKNLFYLNSLYKEVQIIREDVQVIQILGKVGPFSKKPDIDPSFVIAQLKQAEILQKVEEENLLIDEEEIKKTGGSWLSWKTSPRED